MKITFIGSGNVATHLALALNECGHTIQQVWSRNIDHAALLANRVGAEAICHLSDIEQDADVYVMALSDNALFEMSPLLHLNNALVIHTSGATSIDVLKYTSNRRGVLWSPQTFVKEMAMDYATLPFCVEGSDTSTEEQISLLASDISPLVYHTTHIQRQYLHLAAVFANNFTNGMYAIAQKLCGDRGVPFEILYPIIATTAQRAQWGDVRKQLTGPAVRHDTHTINAHRRLLADSPDLLDIYDQLTATLEKLSDS